MASLPRWHGTGNFRKAGGFHMKTQVGDWMTKHPLKIDINEDVKTATNIMRQESISHLLIFDEGWLRGIISEKDLLLADKIKKRLQPHEGMVKITVGDLMSRHPVTVRKDTLMTNAIRLMREKDFRSLPVIDETDTVVGILTQTDIMRFAIVASQARDEFESYSKIMAGN
jgi:acetoin utilization protein AcuB